MNITSINTNQSIYAYSNEKVKTHSLEGVYAPTATEIYSKDNNAKEWKSDTATFNSTIQDMAVSSPEEIAALKDKFADMYVTSAAHEYYFGSQSKATSSLGLLYLRVENANIASKEGCFPVPIEAGELPQFMDKIQNSLTNGMSLEDILKQKYDEHIAKYGEEGHASSFADWFSINTSTGKVMSADPISRTYYGDSLDEEVLDVEAVMELSDDLETFLRYAVFSQETDDPEKVNELFSFIKNKQAYANYDRFLFGSDADNPELAIIEALTAAGDLKTDDKKEEGEAIDELMEAIRIHQEELRENKIDTEGSKKAIAEIQEIIKGNKNEFTFLKSSSIA